MGSFNSRQESQDSSSTSETTTTTAAAAANSSGADITSVEDMCLLAINKPKKRAGRKIFKETRHPIYRGVRKRNGDKWVCELREPNKETRIWLGTYPTLEMAARAHDVAALALRGKSAACLNFADSAWRLPVPASADPAEIRRVAAEAAEMFRPEEFGGCDRSGVEDLSEEMFCTNVGENVEFIGEEEVLEMPRLIDEMAEGLLLSPPYVHGDFGTDDHWSCLDYDYNVSLWSY
ncbi:Dehydration-responsive element-binding protein 1E [Euphorbia peplus]|nr:Dehydration-responsive element-binding protein 1E [Euphorbia peplus]